MSEWIACSERMPPRGPSELFEILVLLEGRVYQCEVQQMCGSENSWGFYGERTNPKTYDIRLEWNCSTNRPRWRWNMPLHWKEPMHWMPMPPEPDEDL